MCILLSAHTVSNSTKPICSKISKIDVHLFVLKSCVVCEIFSSDSKIESISQNLQVTLKIFQEKETKTNEIFHQNRIFLQNELLTKNGIIKSLTETPTNCMKKIKLIY